MSGSFEEGRRRYERDIDPCTNGREETRKEIKIQPSIIDRITHDIVNQLSVISLSCCELRNSAADKLESDQLKEFKRIEIAIQNAADMIQQLKAVVAQDHGPTRTYISSKSALNRSRRQFLYRLVSLSLTPIRSPSLNLFFLSRSHFQPRGRVFF